MSRAGSDPLAPWQPTAADPFDLRQAGHLLRRAAFGGSLAERQDLVRLGVDRAVACVCEPGTGEPVDAALELVVATDEFERVQAWRVWRMLCGGHRLAERMSWFWHGHFATSHEKVGDAAAMARHFDVFDRHGLGRFDDLLLAVGQDPAMLRWLDNDTNAKGAPNENFARELFELFALGRGNYTEQDVREAARAFTGWHVRDHRFHFARPRHDDGDKTVLGARGPLGGEEVIAHTVRQAASARFLARKLCAFFVHPEPDDAEIDAVAARWETSGRDIGATVRAILRSNMFFARRAWRSRIKDPVDLVVGAVRCLGGRASPAELARAASAMGQSIGEPPSVEGWATERAWLTSATWLLRSNFALDLCGGRRYRLTPGALEAVGGENAAAVAERAVDVLLDGHLGERSRGALDRFVAGPAARGPGGRLAVLHLICNLPEAWLL